MKLVGDKKTQPEEFKALTVRWPADSKMPAIRDRWQRFSDGRVQAVYAPSELAVCLMINELLHKLDGSV